MNTVKRNGVKVLKRLHSNLNSLMLSEHWEIIFGRGMGLLLLFLYFMPFTMAQSYSEKFYTDARTINLKASAPPTGAFVWYDMDIDPGWTTEGEWAYGVPLGLGSVCGDPTEGATGTNVYGYNLAGDHENGMPAYSLTTTVLDCSAFENVQLNFWRWLGIEESYYDQAKIEVSNDGNTWSTVWQNPDSITCDGAWNQMAYDISAVADAQPTVYIRWTMGATDYVITYPGWNIDDVALLGNVIDDLDVTPNSALESTGCEGGPFDPACTTYTLTNSGSTSLDWDATWVESYLELTPSTGTLAAGESIDIDACFGSDANLLSAGTYTDTVAFTNTTSGNTMSRDVSLTVFAAPQEPINPSPANASVGVSIDTELSWGVTPAASLLKDFDRVNSSLVSTLLGDVVNSFTAPGFGVNGLTWKDGHLFLSDDFNQIYEVNPQSGAVISVTDPVASYVHDLTWDGTHFWSVGYDESAITKLDTTGTIVGSIPAPIDSIVGITWDGSSLWVSSFHNNLIYELDPVDGTVLSSIPSPDDNLAGMAFDGIALWTNSQYSGLTYRISPEDGTILDVIETPSSFGEPGFGATFDGQFLWIANYYENLVYQVDVDFLPFCSDTYDVYLDTNPSPTTLVASDLNSPTFDPGTLSFDTTYYWKVVAKNCCGEIESSIWSFSTGLPTTVTTWPTAASIFYGETLADATLSGGTGTPIGTFSFAEPTMVPSAADSGNNFEVIYTPDDPNHITVVGVISVIVNQATPIITTPPIATNIRFSQTLNQSILSDGVASVAGTFTFTDPSISPSTTSLQSVTFTPDDTANYNTVTLNVSVTVLNFPGGNGTSGNPYQIATLEDLQALSESPLLWSSYFILIADIDATDTNTWNVGDHDDDNGTSDEAMGFSPIGYESSEFRGEFDGQNHVITMLYINRPNQKYQALFGKVDTGAVISNLGLIDTNITGNDFSGALVGYANYAEITSCHSTGFITGTLGFIGGLAGYCIQTTITSCYSTATVSANGYAAGGLLGSNYYSTMTSSYALGSVSNTDHMTGGLIGRSSQSDVEDCYASGTVSSTEYNVGGLIGASSGSTVIGSSAVGSVSGHQSIGGLIGSNSESTVTSCYATGAVEGAGDYTGGLIGSNNSGGSITSSYATGVVSGAGDYTGGLIGSNNSGDPITSSYATGTVSGNISTGGLTGITFNDLLSCYATGSVSGTTKVGGLTGYSSDGSTIDSCYATGSVSGLSESGGLIGRSYGIVNSSYSTGSLSSSEDDFRGGLVGRLAIGTINQSYWDTESSGQIIGIGFAHVQTFDVTGLTTNQMQQEASFTGFDFDTNPDWAIIEGETRPYLPWQAAALFEGTATPAGSGFKLDTAYIHNVPGAGITLLEYGVVYREDESNELTYFNLTDAPLQESEAVTLNDEIIHGLLENTTYWYRTYAVDSDGNIHYGTERSLTTLALLPVIYVDFDSGSPTGIGTEGDPVDSIASALTLVQLSGAIMINPGTTSEIIIIDQSVTLERNGGSGSAIIGN